MAYEVSAAAEQSDRLVVSVGGVTLVYGEPLDVDREAAEAGDVVIVADQEDGVFVTDSADVSSDLQLLQERVPEVAAAVQVEHKPEPVPDEVEVEVVTEVIPADPADSVVPAGESTPDLERTSTTDVNEVSAETGEQATAESDWSNEGGK